MLAATFVSGAGRAVSAGTGPPKFRDFAVAFQASAIIAKPRIVSEFEKRYRSRLSAANGQRPNFAGRFKLIQWGCGTSCVTGAVISKTGRIIPLPFTVCCAAVQDERFQAIEFRPDSRLIVFSGLRNEEGDNAAHFYAFDGRRFSFVRSIALAHSSEPAAPK